MNKNYQVAKDLLSIKAIYFRPDEPFTWASGIKSPVYCDNRLTLAYPKIRRNIEESISEVIKENFNEVNVIMGTATAGIPHSAIVSDILNLPLGYVRTAKKDHGRKNQIEGKLEKNQKVVVIEDLISTGKSVIETVKVLRENGAIVLGIVSIFSYNMKNGIENLKNENIKSISLTDFDTIIKIAEEENYIKKEDIKKLLKFRDNPQDISWINKE